MPKISLYVLMDFLSDGADETVPQLRISILAAGDGCNENKN